MKKEWQQPTLEVLDVEMTLGGKTGQQLDNDFPNNTSFNDLTFS